MFTSKMQYYPCPSKATLKEGTGATTVSFINHSGLYKLKPAFINLIKIHSLN